MDLSDDQRAKAVADLIAAVQGGDLQQIDSALERLGVRREHDLYSKVGHLAKSLHESLREFKSSLERSNLTMTTTNLPDAADKLEEVIRMTEQAAQKTMNLIDEQGLKIQEARAHARTFVDSLETPEFHTDCMKVKCGEYFAEFEHRMLQLDHLSSEIIVAQAYQDLTGQALQKVVKLVTDIEMQLISLIHLFSPEGSSPEEARTENACEPKSKDETKLSQDAADDLLASLGF